MCCSHFIPTYIIFKYIIAVLVYQAPTYYYLRYNTFLLTSDSWRGVGKFCTRKHFFYHLKTVLNEGGGGSIGRTSFVGRLFFFIKTLSKTLPIYNIIMCHCNNIIVKLKSSIYTYYFTFYISINKFKKQNIIML